MNTENAAESDRDMAPVQKVPCSQCGAEQTEPCRGPGQGWHLNRWDRLRDITEGVIEP